MDKKGTTAISVMIFFLGVLVLFGFALVTFIQKDVSGIVDTKEELRVIDNVKVRSELIKFYLDEIYSGSVSSPNGEEFAESLREEWLKYQIDGKFVEVELAQLEKQLVFENLKYNGRNFELPVRIVINEAVKGIEVSYDFVYVMGEN